MSNTKVYLTKEQAKECIVIKDHKVHTLQPVPGMGMVGFDISEGNIFLLLERNAQIEIAGENARELKHGIVIPDENGRPLFLLTDEKKLQKYDPKK